MTTFTIATWNVNSIKVRLPQVLAWLHDVKPDVLALQEIKLQNENFPYQAIQELGYHVTVSGQKTYNGMAIISREPVTDITVDLPDWEDHQRRVLGVTINDVRILNLYVPNGESVSSEKYLYKLNWLSKLDAFLAMQLAAHPKFITLGDFNIAPDNMDVHDPDLWNGRVLFSEPERHAFQSLLKRGISDCFRTLNPTAQQYSWWDYRLNAYKRNMGMRIDHILASSTAINLCKQCYIDKTPRTWERPSDHAPVIAVFDW